MFDAAFFQSDTFKTVLLPILIFLARITDMSLDTLRIVSISRGMKFVAPVIAFLEILIWLMAISQIMRNLDNPFTFLAYAAGFATGNFVGMTIDEKLAFGISALRVITQENADALLERLREEGYGVTSVKAQGVSGEVSILFCIVKRKQVSNVLAVVTEYNPKAFVSIEDVRSVRGGIVPPGKSRNMLPRWWPRPFRRKGV